LGLLDSGSTDTVIPIEIAYVIGAQLSAERGIIKWRGNEYARQSAQVQLEIGREGTIWRWSAMAVFSPALIGYLLLGDRGCLQFMDVKFLGHDRFVELETNRSFPGEIRSSS